MVGALYERFQYVAIEGPIGVGKTSLATALAERLEANLVLEEALENPFLPKYYGNIKKYAFQTQIFFLVSRYKQQKQITQRDLFNTLTITDYMFDKDRIFASITLNEEELMLYNHLLPLLATNIPKPDLVILLQAPPGVLMNRIRSRGRKFEAGISRDYIEAVAEAYDRFFFNYDASPLLIVNTTHVNFAVDPFDLDSLVLQLEKVESGTQYYVPEKLET
jgi:deoxyguanosine kinase